MLTPLRIGIIVVGVGMLLLTLELIRRGRLRADHALPWLLVAAVVIVLGIAPQLVPLASRLLGVQYPPSVLLTTGLFLLVLVVLFQGITVSDMACKNRDLTQRIAIMGWQIAQVQEELARIGGTDLEPWQPYTVLATTGEEGLGDVGGEYGPPGELRQDETVV